MITNDDLEKEPGKSSREWEESDGASRDPICDDDCESVLRRSLGFTPDREGEFQAQLDLARREVSDDTRWIILLGQSVMTMRNYCSFEKQKQKAAKAGAFSYPAPAGTYEQFEAVERGTRMQMESARNRAFSRINDFRGPEPVRAELMEIQWDRAAQLACPSDPPR